MNAHISAIRNLKKAMNNKSAPNVLNSAQNKVNSTGKNFIAHFDNWVTQAIGLALGKMATAPSPEAAIPAARTVDVLTPILQALQVNIENPTQNTIARVQRVLNTPMWRRRYARTANANTQLRNALSYMKQKLETAGRANAELERVRAGYNRAIGFVAGQGNDAIISAILGYRNSSNKNRNLQTLIGKSPNHANWNNYFRRANNRLKAGPRQTPQPAPSPPSPDNVAAAMARANALRQTQEPSANNPFKNLNVNGLLAAAGRYNTLGPNNKGKLTRAINNKLGTLNVNGSNYEALVRAKNNFGQ
jgi:hypothetical protein